MVIILFLILIACTVGFFVLLVQKFKFNKKYGDLLKSTTEREKLEKEIESMKKDYAEKYRHYEKLQAELGIYEDNLDLAEYGLYKPHFSFATSEKYKQEIDKVRELQKQMIKNGEAAICKTEWTVNGKKSEGKKQTQRYMKLMLRAFNGECDSMTSDVSWNNISRMEERLEKSFEAINKLGETNTTSIVAKYKDLKLKELRLAYEYQEKLHEEKEEQRIIKERMREEERAQKEFEKRIKESQDEENRYNKALEQARKEMEAAKGEELEKLNARIAQIQEELERAKAAHQKALSMAQQTKIGHVYIISNIGSFGENVFKIGMTRRLEPMERIDELGSASVPFNFDVHAMIESDNAPELETEMHKYFDSKRVNLVNPRKEFFNVSIEEIEEFARKKKLNVEFTKLAEARDFRESESIRLANKKDRKKEKANSQDIPKTL